MKTLHAPQNYFSWTSIVVRPPVNNRVRSGLVMTSRRDMLRESATGFGALALAAMLGERVGAADPLVSKAPHFPAKAKRVIFLFMHGGPSQVDTFDYKPLLKRDHGKPLPFQRPKVVSSETFNLLQSPWNFKQYGQSGMWVSDLFPEVAKLVDDICFIKS